MKEIYKNDKLSFSLIDEKNSFVNLKFFNEAVLVIGVNNQDKLLLIKQKRFGQKEINYEFPSGGVKSGESILVAASRELNEETGFEGDLEFIGSTQPLLGLVDFKLNIFLATNLRTSNLKLEKEEYENIECEFLKIEDIKNFIANKDKTVDGYVPIGLGYYLSINKNL